MYCNLMYVALFRWCSFILKYFVYHLHYFQKIRKILAIFSFFFKCHLPFADDISALGNNNKVTD